MIKIGVKDSEICPVKIKSQGAHLFKQACLFSEIRYITALVTLTIMKYVTISNDFNATCQNNYVSDTG